MGIDFNNNNLQVFPADARFLLIWELYMGMGNSLTVGYGWSSSGTAEPMYRFHNATLGVGLIVAYATKPGVCIAPSEQSFLGKPLQASLLQQEAAFCICSPGICTWALQLPGR